MALTQRSFKTLTPIPVLLSVNAVGPVILKVSLDDPEGNYSATSAIRVLEIIEGPGDTDNTEPTDNTPVVDYNPPATPTPSTPPSGTSRPSNLRSVS